MKWSRMGLKTIWKTIQSSNGCASVSKNRSKKRTRQPLSNDLFGGIIKYYQLHKDILYRLTLLFWSFFLVFFIFDIHNRPCNYAYQKGELKNKIKIMWIICFLGIRRTKKVQLLWEWLGQQRERWMQHWEMDESMMNLFYFIIEKFDQRIYQIWAPFAVPCLTFHESFLCFHFW